MFKVVENFLPESYAGEIRSMMYSSSDMTWNYNPVTVSDTSNFQQRFNLPQDIITTPYTKECSFFTHSFYHAASKDSPPYVSEFLNVIHPIRYFAEHHTGQAMESLVRVKGNLMLRQLDWIDGNYVSPHIDIYNRAGDVEKYMTILYYVNDSDGDTVVFNEKYGHKGELTEFTRVKHKANSALIFDSCTFHAATPPKESEYRININMVGVKKRV